LARFGQAWLGLTGFSPTWLGLTGFSPTRFGLAWLGLTSFGLAWLGLTSFGLAWLGLTGCRLARSGMLRRGLLRRGLLRRGPLRRGLLRACLPLSRTGLPLSGLILVVSWRHLRNQKRRHYRSDARKENNSRLHGNLPYLVLHGDYRIGIGSIQNLKGPLLRSYTHPR
jgi:hypothetical protein